MTALDTSDDVDDTEVPARRPRRRRRRPAPKANLFWRFVFPLLVVAAGVAVFVLWRAGTKSVLDSTDGRVLEPVVDPAAESYEVFVEPTPTLLVAHTENGELVGVTVMARTALDAGGSAVLLAADLLVVSEDASGNEIADFMANAWTAGGLERIEFLAETLFGFGFGEVIELDASALAGSIALTEPLPYLLSDELVEEASDGSLTTWLARGRKELDGNEVARVYGFRNPGEAEANRILRQLRVWETWLESIARAEDPLLATLPFESGLPPFLRSLGLGTNDLVALPMEPVGLEPDTPPFYVIGDGGALWLAERALDMVPLPISPRSTVRPTVRLLDGTGDAGNRDLATIEVVGAGGVVSVIGNAEAFGVTETSVVFHRPEVEVQAAAIAEALGVEAALVADFEQPADLTVTIGLDWVAS